MLAGTLHAARVAEDGPARPAVVPPVRGRERLEAAGARLDLLVAHPGRYPICSVSVV